jgi:hypothetical protein
MQVTKYLATAKTSLGDEIIFDLMQVEAYKPTTTDESGQPSTTPLIWIRMESSDVYIVQSDIRKLQAAMSNAGVPFIPV